MIAPIVFFILLITVVILEYLFVHQQNLLLRKAKSDLSPLDYLHFKLDYYSALSGFSDQLAERASIEEEARKLLDIEQFRIFRNDIDDQHIKISQTLISRNLYHRILPLIIFLMSLEQLIFGHQPFETNPHYRLIATVVFAVICLFYFISILKRTFVLIRFNKKLSEVKQ
jgi:hypothetical protein